MITRQGNEPRMGLNRACEQTAIVIGTPFRPVLSFLSDARANAQLAICFLTVRLLI